jgi:hypothetical protein
LKIENLSFAIENHFLNHSIANDKFSMTNSQSSETAQFQSSPTNQALFVHEVHHSPFTPGGRRPPPQDRRATGLATSSKASGGRA